MDQARNLPADQLADFLGEIEVIRITALARITTPPPAESPDGNVDVNEAARRLGVSPQYLYRHAGKFPFVRRIGRKLLFSSEGLSKYLAAKSK